ncbi:MAG: pilus assembly protein [Pseudolabrys sp.]|nr:pilus assembly protein [Pseudolabrys sp.]MBV9261062.1 pilus assembly protein [Pseudolabrys sp.]
MLRPVLNSVRSCAARFFQDRRGVSAIEFSLLAPLMISLYLGGVEISQGIGIDRKVTITAGAMSNLVAQNTTVSASDMTNFFNAASTIMAPYSTTPLKITVSCLTVDSTGKVTVKWSDTKNGTARTVGSTVTVPSALAVPNTSLIFSEVSYGYKPTIGYYISGTLTLSDQMYMTPRQSTTVTHT